jgi:hypothetical protein
MDEFPPNSQKARRLPDEPQKLERVTSAEAVRRKRSLGRRFRETFIGGDARTAAEHTMMEVVVPAIKDTLAEALQSGIERLIYGDSRPRPRRTPGPTTYENVGRVNYQQMSSSPPRSQSNMLSRRARARHNFDEIVIQNRQEANEVIDQLFDVLSRYGSVPVASLYELTGIESSHMDYKWGWTDLRGAKATRLSDGRFLLDLPEPQQLA